MQVPHHLTIGKLGSLVRKNTHAFVIPHRLFFPVTIFFPRPSPPSRRASFPLAPLTWSTTPTSSTGMPTETLFD